MIKIFKNVITEVPFTLFEKTTIPYSGLSFYILDLYSKQTHESVLIQMNLSADTTTNNARYNRFPIDIISYTGSTLMEGQYDYKVWQTSGGTLSTSGLTITDVVESGLCQIIDSPITGSTYNNPKDEYVFE